ncbi:MAG: hypothetical protein QOD24_1489 [Solirubrobacteraceae bacterium]|jgi:ABC-type multidrug transport system fused ATPase/permease subunit|nr:hypothetical protein [Solirubrobacteraceae bacterium]
MTDDTGRLLSLRETARELRTYLGPNLRALLIGGALLVISSLLGLMQPLAARWILDKLAAGEDLLLPILGLCALVIVAALSLAAGSYLMLRSAEEVVLSGRRHIVRQVLSLTMTSMRRQAPGDLLTRVTADTTLLRSITVQSLTQGLLGAVTLCGALVLMGTIDLFLLCAVVVVVIALGGFLSFVLPHVRAASAETQAAVSELGTELERALSAFALVKASGREAQEAGRVGAAAESARSGGTRMARWTALAGAASGVSTQVAFLVVLGAGGWRVQTGALSVPDLIAFLLYVFFLTAPVLQLITASTYFETGRAALGRIVEVQELATEDVIDSATVPQRHWPRRPATLRFENVTFTYPDAERPVLGGLDLEIPAGGVTALVGPSGVGKSTFFALLERFYVPDAGRIVLDGRDLREWPLGELRSLIAYVEQNAPVMAGTLRENLTYAAPDATHDELCDVLGVCRLECLLHRLGGNLDAPISASGSSLSGGERQRIAIARSLLRYPRLLLLDEITSQLDGENEAALRDVVHELAARTTVIVAAHRLSTIRGADRIVVIEDGRIGAIGRHADPLGSDERLRLVGQ